MKRCTAGGRLGRDGKEAEGVVEGAEDGKEEEGGGMMPVSEFVGGEWSGDQSAVACHVPSRWDTFGMLVSVPPVVCGLGMPTAGRTGHGRKAALPDGVLAPASA